MQISIDRLSVVTRSKLVERKDLPARLEATEITGTGQGHGKPVHEYFLQINVPLTQAEFARLIQDSEKL